MVLVWRDVVWRDVVCREVWVEGRKVRVGMNALVGDVYASATMMHGMRHGMHGREVNFILRITDS